MMCVKGNVKGICKTIFWENIKNKEEETKNNFA